MEHAELLALIVEQHHGTGLAVARPLGGVNRTKHPATLVRFRSPAAHKVGKMVRHGGYLILLAGLENGIQSIGEIKYETL